MRSVRPIAHHHQLTSQLCSPPKSTQAFSLESSRTEAMPPQKRPLVGASVASCDGLIALAAAQERDVSDAGRKELERAIRLPSKSDEVVLELNRRLLLQDGPFCS